MKRNLKSVKAMTGSAFLVAVSVVLTRFLSPYLAIAGANSLRIGLGTVPIMIAGIVFGPVYGGVVGGAADLIGALLFPSGAYTPGFTLSAILQGVLPYLVVRLFSGRPKARLALTSFLLFSLVAVNISFLIGHDSYKFSPDLILKFTNVGKIFFILGLSLVFSSLLVVFYFIGKSVRPRNSAAKLKIEDILLFALVNETVVNVFISSIWKMLYFKLSYVAMTFSASILLLVDVPIKALVIFSILVPLAKVYPEWAVSSRKTGIFKELKARARLIPEREN